MHAVSCHAVEVGEDQGLHKRGDEEQDGDRVGRGRDVHKAGGVDFHWIEGGSFCVTALVALFFI